MLSKFNFKNIIRNMPAFTAGVFCWIFIWIFTGSSCLIRSTFGIPCPGCGSTRALFSLFRGDIKKALEFHPLIFFTLVLIFAYILTLILRINIYSQTKNKKIKYINIFLWCVFAVYMGVYIIRMILFYPNIEPMTYLDTSIVGRTISFLKNII